MNCRVSRIGIGLVLLFTLMISPPAKAADGKNQRKPDQSLLTNEQIYSSERFNSESYPTQWCDDGESVWNLVASKSVPGGRDIVKKHVQSGKIEIVVPAYHLTPGGEGAPLTIESYQFSPDGSKVLVYTNSKRVWRQHSRGDYWVLDRSSRELWQLGGREAEESTLQFAKFSPDSQRVAYVRENNIYVEDLVSRRITALTSTGSETIINGTFDWVYEEEFSLRDGFRWSSDSRSIAYWQLDTTGVPTFTMIDNLSDFYPKTITFAHPKTGQTNSAARVGVVDLGTNETRWLKLPGDPRSNYIARMDWAPVTTDGRQELLIEQYNRLQNRCNVYLADPKQADKPRLLFVERDDAWIDVLDQTFWLADNRQFTWISERDGWLHVYLVDRISGEQRMITPGEYDVMQLVCLDESNGTAYLYASPENATQQYLYKVSLQGGAPVRVTPDDMPGSHSYAISPDGQLAILSSSSIDHPPITRLVRLPSHEEICVLDDNRSLVNEFKKLQRGPIEFVKVNIGNDEVTEGPTVLDGWCIKPPNFDPKKRYPVLVYVYGEPAGSTVKDRWGGSTFLWHLMLAQKGYVVMNFDNRGTPVPKGREWRKSVYRKIGIIAPDDQARALQKMIDENSWIDPQRTAIWGWSGGGSMSLHAIFEHPELYSAAMAVAPVPNERCYDTIYQERYMGLPGDNVEGYIQGSPITHAAGLEGDLLIVHGTGDDNCHYATIEQLIDELVRYGKQFSMMAYPNRTHSIRERAGTTLHLRELLTQYLLDHVEPGAK